MKIAIVTGASSGMGREFVLQLDRMCNDLDQIWAISRRIEEAEFPTTKAEIIKIPLDLTDETSYQVLQAKLETETPKIKILVNSAGFGKMGNFAEIPLNTQTDMMECNTIALMKMCHLCIPAMVSGAYIINMASAAAFLPQMRFAVYAASKSFVLSFSRALGYELKERKISVTAVCPGPVKTRFFDIAEETGYTLSIKKFFMVKPDKVVAYAIKCAKERKQLSIYGSAMKGLYFISHILPHRLILEIYDKMV
jgi:short-subunit dehydrogenase